MGKNVYAAPRKGSLGKRVEKTNEKGFTKDRQQTRKEHLAALAEKYKKSKEQVEHTC